MMREDVELKKRRILSAVQSPWLVDDGCRNALEVVAVALIEVMDALADAAKTPAVAAQEARHGE